MADWKKIKTEYLTTDTSYRKLAQKYGVGASTLYARASKEKWVEAKEQHQSKTIAKTLNAIGSQQASRAARLQTVADKLLVKIEAAVEDLNMAELFMDKQALRQITGALKDIKDIQMIKSDADLREQEARIANLRRQAEKGEEKEEGYHGVVLLPVVADMPAPPEDDADG